MAGRGGYCHDGRTFINYGKYQGVKSSQSVVNEKPVLFPPMLSRGRTIALSWSAAAQPQRVCE